MAYFGPGFGRFLIGGFQNIFAAAVRVSDHIFQKDIGFPYFAQKGEEIFNVYKIHQIFNDLTLGFLKCKQQ